MDERGFIAEQKDLEFYNGKALLNLVMEFIYIDDDGEESDFNFYGYQSAYFRVYDSIDREQLLKEFTSQIIRSDNSLILNVNDDDMTFEDYGYYFFEIGYNNSGYEVPLRFGKIKII